MEKLLGRLMFKKGAPTTMADARIQDVFPSAAADDDLSSWEIVDLSDDDESEDYSFGEDEDGEIRVVESPSSDLSTRGDLIDFTDDDHQDLVQEDLVKRESIDERFGFYDNGDDDDKEEEEDGYGYGYDLDDELVPKSVSDRFGRQRLRKLGKKNKSKRLPYYYNRPGCVHGKHGLGLKLNINF